MIYLIAFWVIFHAFWRLLIFFKSNLEKILSGIPSECQTVWTLIRPDNLSGLIWVQFVCQGYQQTTLVDTEITIAQCKSYTKISISQVIVSRKPIISQLRQIEINYETKMHISLHIIYTAEELRCAFDDI